MDRRVTAALLSGLACPGAGQIYKKRYIKGGILAAVTLGLLTAVAYKTWSAMFDIALAMPPEEAMGNIRQLARTILESNKGFYDGIGGALLIVWAYAVLDAYFSK